MHKRPNEGRPYRRLKQHIARTQKICWLCGTAIDDTLQSPHPYSRSLDHVTPISMGGNILDPNNARAAHRRCNQRRGTGKPQARRQSRSW